MDFKNLFKKKRKQTTFIYCPKCNNELIKNGNCIQYQNKLIKRDNCIKNKELIYYKCSKCGYESKWLFDAPCPILILGG